MITAKQARELVLEKQREEAAALEEKHAALIIQKSLAESEARSRLEEVLIDIEKVVKFESRNKGTWTRYNLPSNTLGEALYPLVIESLVSAGYKAAHLYWYFQGSSFGYDDPSYPAETSHILDISWDK